MFYPREDGHVSLLVEDGKTVTVSGKGKRTNVDVPVVKIRPRTTAALLAIAGRLLEAPPRLSDDKAFETIVDSENFVELTKVDSDQRIGGYSVPFLRGLLDALDPNESAPPVTVKHVIAIEERKHTCGCCAGVQKISTARGSTVSPNSSLQVPISENLWATHSVRVSVVPDFLRRLEVFINAVRFRDIIVGRNATLVFDRDVSFAVANNLLCHHGSRIVQKANFLNLDVTGTMRGSVADISWKFRGDVLTIDWEKVAADLGTKP